MNKEIMELVLNYTNEQQLAYFYGWAHANGLRPTPEDAQEALKISKEAIAEYKASL